jgi:DNA-binding transcriptional LysR family regulator
MRLTLRMIDRQHYIKYINMNYQSFLLIRGRHMELRHLRYFLAVAEEGHFGRAAEKLHIVQPALSMQIRSLEDELGGPLFERTSRRVMLTDAGIAFRLEAARTIAQADHARQTAQRAMRGEVGKVRLGFAGNAIFTGRLTDDLRVFSQTHARVELEIHHMAPRSQAEAILKGRLDVGYAPSFGIEFDPQLVAESIGEWPWVVGMMAGHPLASLPSLTTASLLTQPFVLYAGPETDRAQTAVLRDVLGFEPNIAYRAPDTLSVLALTAAGLGLTLVPAPLAGMSVPDVVYRAIDDSNARADLVLISRKNETSGAVRGFLNVARQSGPCVTHETISDG